MLVSMIFLGLQSYLLSAETLDGTSTEFLKEYIQASDINNILIIKERIGGYHQKKVKTIYYVI